jgi:hypothetical protein
MLPAALCDSAWPYKTPHSSTQFYICRLFDDDDSLLPPPLQVSTVNFCPSSTGRFLSICLSAFISGPVQDAYLSLAVLCLDSFSSYTVPCLYICLSPFLSPAPAVLCSSLLGSQVLFLSSVIIYATCSSLWLSRALQNSTQFYICWLFAADDSLLPPPLHGSTVNCCPSSTVPCLYICISKFISCPVQDAYLSLAVLCLALLGSQVLCLLFQ